MKKTIALAGRMGVGKDTIATELQKKHGYVVVGFADALKQVAMAAYGQYLPEDAVWGPSEERNKVLEDPITKEVLAKGASSLMKFSPQIVTSLFGDRLLTRDIANSLTTALGPFTPFTTARELLQRLGTEWGRNIWSDVWIEAVRRVRDGVALGIPYFRHDGLMSNLHTRQTPAPVVIPDCRFPNEAEFVAKRMGGLVVWVDADQRVPSDPKFAHASETTMDKLGNVGYVLNNNGAEEHLQYEVAMLAQESGASLA